MSTNANSTLNRRNLFPSDIVSYLFSNICFVIESSPLPVDELAREGAAGNFLELALILAESGGRDLVHFSWYRADESALRQKIDRLVKQGWIPLAMMGIDSDGRLLAKPLKEHAKGNGIECYLRNVMNRAERLYNEGPDPISRAIH